MLKNAPNPIDVQEFQFHLRSRLKVFDHNEPEIFREQCNLLACASRFGLIFVGTHSAHFQVIQFRHLEAITDTKKDVEDYARRCVPTASRVKYLSLNCEQTLLAVVVEKDGCAVAVFYDVRSFWQKEVRSVEEVRLSATPGVHVLDIGWNPTLAAVFTVCKSDGSLSVIELKQPGLDINEIPAAAGCTCFSWSPKGKQIAVGCTQGKITQYKPDLKAVKAINAPPLSEPHSLLSLLWISNYQFIGLYHRGDSDCLITVDAPKTGDVSFTNFYDVCYSIGNARTAQFYMLLQHHWNVLLVASSNSMEVGVLGAEKDIWSQWTLGDAARAELPMHAKTQETFPIGVAMDTASTQPVPWGEGFLQPTPFLLMLSNYGTLCCFHVVNLKQGVAGLCSPPDPIQDTAGSELFVKEIPLEQTVKPLQQPQMPQVQQSQMLLGPNVSIVPVVKSTAPQVLPSNNAITLTPLAKSTPLPLAPKYQQILQKIDEPAFTLPAVVETPKKPPEPEKVVEMPPKFEQNDPETEEICANLIRDECLLLESELKATLHHGKHLQSANLVGSDEDKTTLVNLTAAVEEYFQAMTELCTSQAAEVHVLKQNLLQAWSLYENAKSQYFMSKEASMVLVLKAQPLDGASQKQLHDIRHMDYYLESQLMQAHRALDEQWDTFQDYCKKKHKLEIPTIEKIFQALVKQSAIIQKESYVLKDIANKLRNRPRTALGTSILTALNESKDVEEEIRRLRLNPDDINTLQYEHVLNRNKFFTLVKVKNLHTFLKNRSFPRVKPVKPRVSGEATPAAKFTRKAAELLPKKLDFAGPKVQYQSSSAFASTSATPVQFTFGETLKANIVTPSTQKMTASFSPIIQVGGGVKSAPSSVIPSKLLSVTTTKQPVFAVPSVTSGTASLFSNVTAFGSTSTAAAPKTTASKSLFGATTQQIAANKSVAAAATSTFIQNPTFGSTVSATVTPTLMFGSTSSTTSTTQAMNLTSAASGKSLFGNNASSIFATAAAPANTTAQSSLFGGSSTSASIFGSSGTTQVSKPSIFGTTPTTGTSFFGNAATSNSGSIFGATSTSTPAISIPNPTSSTAAVTSTFTTAVTPVTAATKPIFGTAVTSTTPVTTASVFGAMTTVATTSVFGTPTTVTSVTPTSKPTLFGMTATTATAGSFSATAATTSGSSIFGATPATSTVFGGVAPVTTATTSAVTTSTSAGAATTPSIFSGAATPATSATSVFGSPATTQPVIFGSTPSANQSPVVGSTSTPTTVSLFGSTASTQPSIFGSTPTSTQSTVFGGTTSAQSTVFGSTPSTSSQPTMFGSTTSAQSTVFGSIPTSTQSTLFGNTQPPSFGNTPSTTQSSLFGSTPATSSASVFGSTSAPTSTPIFAESSASKSLFGSAAAGTTTSPMFGSAAAVTTTTTPMFGSTVAITSTTPMFGSPAAVTTSTTPMFGAAATTSSIFGSTAAAASSTTPLFGGAASTTSIFGAPATTAAQLFGSTPTVTTSQTLTSPFGSQSGSIFGTASTTSSQSSMFGSQSQPFGTASSTFGSGAATGTTAAAFTSQSPFASTQQTFGTTPAFGGSTNVFAAAASTFGQSGGSIFGGGNAAAAAPTTTTSSPFGTSAFGSASLFGGSSDNAQQSTFQGQSAGSFGFGTMNIASTATSPFGQSAANPFASQTAPKNVFGSPAAAAATPSAFGTSSSGSIFGGGASFGSGGSSFGNQSLFGQQTQQQSSFGSSTFGQQSSTSGPFSSGVFQGSVSQTGFSAASAQPTFGSGAASPGSATAGAFGATPSFGASAQFGSAPSFGGAATFGATSTFGGGQQKIFGGGGAPAAGFGGGETATGTGFGSLATQQTVGFGNLAQQAATPAPSSNAPFSGNSSFSSWR